MCVYVLDNNLPKCSFVFCHMDTFHTSSVHFLCYPTGQVLLCAGLVWAPGRPWGSPISDGAVVGDRQAVCFPVSLCCLSPRPSCSAPLGLGGEVGKVFLCSMRDGQVGIYGSLENKLFPGDKAIPPFSRSYSGSFPGPC